MKTKLIKLVQSTDKSSSLGATFDVTTNTATFSSDLGTDLCVKLRDDGRIDITEVSEYGPETTFNGRAELDGVKEWIRQVEIEYRNRRK